MKATAHSSRTKVEIFLNTRKAKKATEGRGSNGNGQRSLILAHVHKTSRANTHTHTHTKQQLWVRIAACSLYTAVTAFLQMFLTSKKSACCLNVLWVNIHVPLENESALGFHTKKLCNNIPFGKGLVQPNYFK